MVGKRGLKVRKNNSTDDYKCKDSNFKKKTGGPQSDLSGIAQCLHFE